VLRDGVTEMQKRALQNTEIAFFTEVFAELGRESNFGVLERTLLHLGDSVAQHDDSVDGCIVVVLEVKD
jgi:hypothetical protein